jgi:hypothetical protein
MNSDIKKFIDFFHDACLRIRKEKAKFVRGKDGNLINLALKKFSRQQLEMLACWFFEKKRKVSPTIGAMLSYTMTEELERKIKDPNFWKDLDKIHEKYFRPK